MHFFQGEVQNFYRPSYITNQLKNLVNSYSKLLRKLFKVGVVIF